MPRVSVLIPTYNRSVLFAEAVRSVTAQDFRDYEIVAVDDGSTDDTAAVADSFGDAIRYIRQDHAGPAAARNLGLRHARGEFVAFLDSDDLFLPHKLRTQVEYLDAHPSAGLVYSSFTRVDTQTDTAAVVRAVLPSRPTSFGRVVEQLLFHCPVATPTVVARRGALEAAGGFDEQLPYLEDIDLWCRIAHGHDLGAIAEPLSIVRRHAANMTIGAAPELLTRCRLRLARKAAAYAGLARPELGRILAHIHSLAWSQSSRRAGRRALAHLGRAIRANPAAGRRQLSDLARRAEELIRLRDEFGRLSAAYANVRETYAAECRRLHADHSLYVAECTRTNAELARVTQANGALTAELARIHEAHRAFAGEYGRTAAELARVSAAAAAAEATRLAEAARAAEAEARAAEADRAAAANLARVSALAAAEVGRLTEANRVNAAAADRAAELARATAGELEQVRARAEEACARLAEYEAGRWHRLGRRLRGPRRFARRALALSGRLRRAWAARLRRWLVVPRAAKR